MKYPLVSKDNWNIPKDGICPFCKEKPITSSNGFAQFSGGADNGDNAFMYFMYHHEPVEKEQNSVIHIAEDVKIGQFDIQFCSIKCMRGFFNTLFDEMENNIKNS